jgi:hypothetical protein
MKIGCHLLRYGSRRKEVNITGHANITNWTLNYGVMKMLLFIATTKCYSYFMNAYTISRSKLCYLSLYIKIKVRILFSKIDNPLPDEAES